jgi:hypothetical protein
MNRFSLVNAVAAVVITAAQWTALFNPLAHTHSPRVVAASVSDDVATGSDDTMPVVVITAHRRQS